MSITIRPATEQDIPAIVAMVNEYAAKNIMLPRSEASIQQSLPDWLVAMDTTDPDAEVLAGCGSLVSLTDTLVEIRSLAVYEAYQGLGIGGKLVTALVDEAREREFEQVCALTLSAGFFTRQGFEVVDRWSISPKVWQACIYCAKFHHCDEVAVLKPLVDRPTPIDHRPEEKTPAWNGLLRWNAWQPLKLAYQHKDGQENE